MLNRCESIPTKPLTDVNKGEKKAAVGKLSTESHNKPQRPLAPANERITSTIPTFCIRLVPKVMNSAMGIRMWILYRVGKYSRLDINRK